MATNALKYIKNVGKSVTYASVDVLKELNPVFTSLIEENKETTTSMYKSVRDIKNTAKKMPGMIKESDYGKYSRKLLNNLKEDLRTGNFYNKERKDSMNGFGDFDDFDFGDDDFGGFDNSFDSFDDNFDTDNMMDIVGEKASTAVSNTMARSAEYITESNTENRKAITNQMNVMYSGIHAGMSTINQNISKIIEFSTEHAATHFENSRTFYTEITRLDNERNAYLKEISESLKAMNQVPKRDPKYRNNTYSDITSYEGALNIESYMKNIKNNISNSVGGYTDILKMVVDNDMFTDSPLETIMTILMSSMVPGAIKNSMETLNKSVGSLAANAILGLKNKSRTKGGIWDTLNNIFGVNTSLETKIDTSNYEKGRVPFDGITRKAIVEVIPTYLAKILAALNGKPENRYNYETGKFTDINEIQKQYDNMFKNSANRAAWDIDRVVGDKKKKLSFRDDADKKQFEDDWEEIKQYMFKNQKTFNTRDKSLSAKSFGLKGGMASDVNVKRLQEMLDGSPEMMHYANSMLREIDSHNRNMAKQTDMSTLTTLFNGSVSNAASEGTSGIRSIVSGANNDVISELIAIHKELSYIRMYGTGGGYGSGSRKGKGGPKNKPPGFDNFEIPVMRKGNDHAYDMNQKQYDNRPNSNVESENISDNISDNIKDAKNDALGSSNNATATKSFSEKMHEASSLSAKMAVLVESATELSKKPAKFIVAMMDKADNRLYDLIYGTKEDKKGKKSFAGRMFKGLESMFDKFSEFVTEHVMEPLKKTFNKENLHNMVSGFFNSLGIDIDQKVSDIKKAVFGEKDEKGKRSGGFFGDFIQGFKDDMTSAGGWVKNTFKGAKDWVTKDAGLKNNKRNKDLDERIQRVKDLAGRAASDMKEAATGIRRVDKTGLAVISEGEMVIPPDMNPLNIAKRRRNEKKVKQDLLSGINSISEFAEGTDDAKILYGSKEADDAIIEILKRNPKLADKLIAKYESAKDKKSITDLILDEYANLIGNVRNAADNFGMSDEQTEDFKEKALKLIGNVKDYGHTMAAGATIGAGVSVFTGLIGGPLVGAAVGAGAGLLSKSETLQKMLFGDIKEDEKGNKSRAGGIIPKHITEKIKAYFPDMSKGATVGGILAAMPFVPGGPLAGMLIGSGIGFAKNSAKVQNLLFGDEGQGLLGMTKEDFGKKVRSVLPKMGAGAVAGLLAGPFGLGTNLLLGSAVGFAADTDKFKELVFGTKKEGENGKETFEGGLFGDFKKFLNEDILDPLRRAKDPFIEQFKIMGDTITDALKSVFKESIGNPINNFLKDKLLKPLNGFLKGVLGAAAKPIKSVISAPFKAIGKAGDALRARQIKSGRAANYMQSAAERNLFRQSKGSIYMGVGGKDKYRDIDASLENIKNVDDLNSIQTALSAIKNTNVSIDKIRDDSFKSIGSTFKNTQIDSKTKNLALKMIKAGQYEKAETFIKDNPNIDEKSKQDLLKKIASEAAKMKYSKQMKENTKGTTAELADRMRRLGLNISDDMINSLAKGGKDADQLLKVISGEIDFRNATTGASKSNNKDKENGTETTKAIDKLNEDQNENNEKIVNKVDVIIDLLTKQLEKKADLSTEENQANLNARYKRNLEVAGLDEEAKKIKAKAVVGENELTYLSDYLTDRFSNGAIRGILGLGKDIVKGGVKTAANTIGGTLGVGGALLNTVGTIGSSVAKAGTQIFNASKAGKFVNEKKRKLFGDKNKKWFVSKGEYRIPNTEEAEKEVDNAGNAAEGKVGKDNSWSLFGIWKDIRAGVKRMAGVLSAMAFNDGIDTTKINDKGDTESFLNKIKNKFQKGHETITQFVDGLPIKMIRDKNGDYTPDVSDADTDNNFKIINEKQETQKGILANLSSMPSMLGGLFSNIFGKGKNGDEEEESFLEKIFKFFTGSAGGVTLLSVLGGALTAAGITGALDNIASSLSGGAFGSKGANDKLYVDGKEIKLDEDGNPMKDENGNYITANGESVSGYLQKNSSLANMSLSDRLKYNLARGTVTGKGSIVGSVVKNSKIGKAVAGSSPVKALSKLTAAGTDSFALLEVNDIIQDSVNKWAGIIKKCPFISKYAANIDELSQALLALVRKHLPTATGALATVKSTLGKVVLPMLILTTVNDFITGMQDASNTLKISADYVTIPQKIVCGLVRTIKNFIPIIGTFIPDSIVTDLFINYVSSWFGIDASKIKEQQSEAQEQLDAYNQANGTDLSWAEYNKLENGQYTWTEKVSNAVSSFGANVKDKGLVGAIGSGIANSKVGKAVSGFASSAKEKIVSAGSWVKDKATSAGTWVKDKATSAGSWVKDKATSAVDAVRDFVSPVADAVKGTVGTVKDLGSYALKVAGDAISEALHGAETDKMDLVIDKDDPYASYKHILYNLTKIVLLPATGIIKVGRTIWEDGIKPIANGIVQVGSGIGTTAKTIMSKSWSGDFMGAMQDTSGNVQSDNDFLANTSNVINGITKVFMAIPGLLSYGLGSTVRGIKSLVSGVVQVGSGVGTSVESLMTKSWQGDITGAFTDTSGNLTTDNELLNNISGVVNGAVKTTLFVPALLSSGIGFVVRNFHHVIDGFKTVGSSISDTVTSIMDSAFKGELTLSQYLDTSTNADTGNGLVDGASSVVNGIIKVGMAPAALLTTGFNFAKNKVVGFFGELAKAGQISDVDKQVIEKAKDGDLSPFSSEYWKVNSDLTGVAGGFNWLVSMMNKIFSLPTAIISYLNPLEIIKKGIGWVAKKLGIDDSETYAETNDAVKYTGVSGSRLVGRGSGIDDGSFVSQVDPKYKDKTFNTASDTKVQTLGNTGCAPAAAAMAINASMGSNVETMDNASKLALKYKVKDDGVSADYFGDQFARHGMTAKYIESNGSSGSAQIMKELMSSNKVVLMGQDNTNTSKATSPFGANPHYVVATGLSDDGKYIFINDPESTTPNMKYETNKILKSSSLGISAKVANGTKKVTGKLRKFIGRGAYDSDSIQYKVWNALRNAGYNEITTAATMGNIEAESGFNPSAIEKGSSVGFGLIQWSYGRRTALEREAAQRGVNPSNLAFQIEYLLSELEPNSGQWTKASSSYGLGSLTRDDWASGKDISAATKAFMCCFERPSYDPKINHIDRRLEAAAKYYKEFTGSTIDTNLNMSYSSGSTSYGGTTSSSTQPKNAISEILSVFSGLSKAYGFTSGDTSSSSYGSSSSSISGNPTDTVMSASGNVSSNPEHAKYQRALVEKMYSIQGKLKYAQDNAKYPGSRNPEDGSGDCSSTVQWAYKNILGVDPGGWTGAQRENSNTFTVATSTKDESKLQLGDLLLKDGHVEMYAGNGQMIGHGSGYGPQVKPLDQSGKYDLVRRWVGFQNTAASGSGLKPAYSSALKYVENKDLNKSLPINLSAKDLEKNKSDIIEFNSNKVASGSKRYVGRATEIPAETVDASNKENNDLRTMVASIVKLLVQVVTNTDTLNNIAKLLGDYLTATEKVAKGTEDLAKASATSSNNKLDQNQKNTAILAKQNLINALQSANTGSSSTQLLKLIEATEKIARE